MNGKTFIIIGIVFMILGLLWQFGGKWFALGKLPGDIVVKKENMTFYFPIVTCVIISIAITLISYLLRFFDN